MVIYAATVTPNSDDLIPAAETVLKKSTVWLPNSKRKNANVIVGKVKAKNLRQISTLIASTAPQVELALIEVHNSIPARIREAIDDLTKEAQQHGWSVRYSKHYSNDVGGVYVKASTFIVLDTLSVRPIGNVRTIAAPERIDRWRRFHQMGKSDQEQARKANRLLGISSGILATLERWEAKVGPMPPMLDSTFGKDLSEEWLGWSFGHGCRPLTLRKATTASIPDMAALGWQTAAGFEETGYTEPRLF